MQYPLLNEISSTRDMTDTFGGYNHNPRIPLGDFYDMKNLTSKNYPIFSPRAKRGVFAYPTGIDADTDGIICKDALCYVNDGHFYINNYEISDFSLTSGEKTLISMGAYVIILPDKKYINTIDYTDRGDIEATATASNLTFTLTNIDGVAYTPYVSPIEPETPTDHPLWLDTSVTPNALKEWSTSSSMWVTVITTYIKIAASNIGANFKEGDGVKISGITDSRLADLNSTMVIQKCDTNYIVVIGIIDEVITQATGTVTVTRPMPLMDFVIESGNRLWGCRYGTNIDGDVVNEIYASKLGDFKNWYCFQGISTDSWMASRGSDGKFTGAISFGGYPHFFKENILHKVYGDMPSQYGIQDTALRGVQDGSSRSLAIVGETLFYKSNNGICAYEGALPYEISEPFGEEKYSNAVAGAWGDKYYISMKNRQDTYDLFAYDKAKNLWHKEDTLQADAFCECDGNMYYIDHTTKAIRLIEHREGYSTPLEEGNIKWFAETGIIGLSSPDHQYISRIGLCFKADIGAKFSLKIQYDSDGYWHDMFGEPYFSQSLKTTTLTARPRRCDHFKLKLEGEGDVKIFSLTKTMSEGSDEF